MDDEPRPGWLNWLASSVQGVFDIASPPAKRWTGSVLAKGAQVRLPFTPGLRVEDAALRLAVVTHVWPGKESRLYRVDGSSRGNPPGFRFLRELPVTSQDVAADDRPVALLLHGFCSTTTGPHFEPLKRWLTDPTTGRYGLVLGFECDTVQRRVPDLADDLRRLLAAAGLLEGRRRLDLYTHSMGGVVARWLLESPDAPDSPAQSVVRSSVRRLIMAGPPNRGTRIAELGDQLMRRLQSEKRLPEQGDLSAFRLPLISAMARRIAPKVPAARAVTRALNDMEPGSEMLTALLDRSAVRPDSPAYYLIRGVYHPVPAGESVPVRLLREAGALLGDCDPRWSDLIVSAHSQMGFQPLYSGRGVQPLQHMVLNQTWHHQYWLDESVFDAIRGRLLEVLPA